MTPLPTNERHIVVTLLPRPVVRIFDRAGQLVSGKECPDIYAAARAVIRAKRYDDATAPPEADKEVFATLTAEEYDALHWAACRANLKQDQLLKRALVAEVRRIARESVGHGSRVPQKIMEFLETDPVQHGDRQNSLRELR